MLTLTNRIPSYLIVIVIFVVTIFGCGRHSAGTERLDMAESLIWSAPDSAFTILETVSPDSLNTGEEKARYALLYTMAMDKNYLKPDNDSLIGSAVDYYSSKNNIPRLMVANFYRGRVQQHNGTYPQALLSFYEAKELAEKSDSSFWAGMACRGISDIYGENYNRAEELAFAQKEYDYIKKSGRQPHLNYALYDLGKTYGNNGNFSKTLSIVNRLIDSATVHQDPYLHYCALQLKSYALINDKKYSMAHAVLTEICNSGFAECTDSLNLCRVLAHTRQTNDALTLLEKTSDNDPGFKRMVRYLIYSKNKQFDKAIKEGEVVDNIADSILRVSMSRNIAGTISEYFEMKKKFSETELEVSRLRTWILIIVFIVTVCTLTVITIYVYRRQKHEIDQKVLFAGQLQKELKYNRQDLDRIIKNLDKTKDDLAKSKEDLNKTKGDLAKSKEDLSKTKKDLVKSNEDLNKTKEDLAKSNEDLSKTKGDLAKSKEDLNKTKEDLAKSKEDLSKTKEDLAKSNEDLNKTKDDLAKSIQHLDTSKNENKHAFDVIKFLWSTKYELLEQLAEINIYNTDSKVMRQKIADIVSKLIDDFKHHSDKTVELENNVDLLYTIVR